MYKDCKVPVQQLRRRIDHNTVKYKSTKDVAPLKTVIGQKRAVSSINFALDIDNSGYNIFVTGSYGTGRTTIVTDLLKDAAKKRAVPSDWAFVYNFDNADEPICLEIPAGQGLKLKKDMQRLIINLANDLRITFESKTFLNRKNEIVESINLEKQEIYSELERAALNMNIQIKSSAMGFVTIPMADGKPLESQQFQELSPEKQDEITGNVNKIQKKIQEVARNIRILDRKLQEKIDKLNTDTARYIVDNHFSALIEDYASCKDVREYLQKAADDIISNVYEFLGTDEKNDGKHTLKELPYRINKYQINVVIDNSKKQGAAVIIESNPTYNNLFGRIEKKAFQGFAYTDYTMIKAGSLLAANGGYLIIDAEQLLKQPFSYEALKRALRSRELHIEDYFELSGFTSTIGLKPAHVPLGVKVVLIGQKYIYHWLYNYDEEFNKIFKVRADFDTEVKDSPAIVKKYIQFISRVIKEEKLLHFNDGGIASIIEHGYRLADHKKKISLRFGEIVKVIREASFWAKKRRKKDVSREDVEYAIKTRVSRHDMIEEKIQDSIIDHTINVDVKGFKVGQVNGLAVYDLGDYSFGKPTRITINTYIGSRGIINIEREAKLSGRLHDKGLLVLSGYFSEKFGSDMPLSFSASITFEQSYSTIDGDSASSAELYGLLSSLARIPINQGIAVTGSVNQKGEVQAIGGVNEKIEGFYRVCKARGLSGEQGVIIPQANSKNLMLSSEIIEAVENGKFLIWSVDHIEDGIRILTGMNAGIKHKDGTYTKESVFEYVRQRLIEFAKTSKNFNKSISDEKKKEDINENEENKAE